MIKLNLNGKILSFEESPELSQNMMVSYGAKPGDPNYILKIDNNGWRIWELPNVLEYKPVYEKR